MATFAPPAPDSASLEGVAHREVREVMTPGVVTVAEGASVRQARRAMQSHGIHGVLVVGHSHGRPLGWVTARGLLDWVEREESIASAREAITQPPASIDPSAPVGDAVRALSQPGFTHLLVQRSPERMPEGVVTVIDLLALGAD